MGFFSKTAQRIVISSDERDALEGFASQLTTQKIRDIKISSVRQLENDWQCIINCKLAEGLYYQEVLPLLYASAKTQEFRITLELDSRSEPARRCPGELLVSFALKSRLAYGDESEHEFIQKLHTNILQGVYVAPATVSYYIVGGGSVTMSVPCLDIERMDLSIKGELKKYGIEKFMMNAVERELT